MSIILPIGVLRSEHVINKGKILASFFPPRGKGGLGIGGEGKADQGIAGARTDALGRAGAREEAGIASTCRRGQGLRWR